jgi:hypothetical protein
MPVTLCEMCCPEPHQIELKFILQFHVHMRCLSRGSNLFLLENKLEVGLTSIHCQQI